MGHAPARSRRCVGRTGAAADTIVQKAARLVLDSDKPIKVIENGKLLGIVCGDDILRVIVAEDTGDDS